MAPLRIVRRRRLLTQRDLAEKAGVMLSTVYLIETGRTTPVLKVMRKICAALDVGPEEIDEFRAVLEGDPPTRKSNVRHAA